MGSSSPNTSSSIVGCRETEQCREKIVTTHGQIARPSREAKHPIVLSVADAAAIVNVELLYTWLMVADSVRQSSSES